MAITKDRHPMRMGVVTRVMSLHVMVSCDSLHGRLLKFSKKTGRKVRPYAQTSMWIRPWTSRDENVHRQLERDIRASFQDISTVLGVTPEPVLRKVYELVKEIHRLLPTGVT